MGLTGWSALTSSGEIADTPANCFRYRIAEEFRVRLGEIVSVINSSDRWLLRIEDEGGQTILRQMVTLPISGMGMVGMFFAWWFDDGAEVIDTTVFGAESRTTALSQPTGVSDTTLWLDDLTGWPQPAGAVQIGGEVVRYAGRVRLAAGGWQLTGCQRGQDGTSPAAHPAGAQATDASGLGHIMAQTTVVNGVDARASVIEADDLREFPASGSAYVGLVDSSGNLRMSYEHVDYEGVDTSTWPHRLTGCRRGRLGRLARTWDAGAVVREAPAIQTGADGGLAYPGGGSDYTWEEGIIGFDWEGPIYALSVPTGAKVVFAGHWTGNAALPLNLDIVSTAVCSGDTWSALYVPETGYWWVADSSGGNGVVVRAAHDLRALGTDCSAEVASPAGPSTWTGALAFDGRSSTASSCTNPILLRRGISPALVYSKAGGAFYEHCLAGGAWEGPVQLTDKRVVAAANDAAGTLVCIAVGGNKTYVLRTSLNPLQTADYMAPGRVEQIVPTIYNAATGQQEPFPALPEVTHRLEARGSGHLRLLTADGRYFESLDGGNTWSQ